MLKRLRIKNFMVLENVAIDPSNGLTQIDGTTLDSDGYDSNGVGKSALLEAIQYGIYGVYSRGKADEVVRAGSKGGCVVQLELQVPAGLLSISRYRKHTKHKNQLMADLDGEPIKGEDNKALQEQINELVGMDAETFRRVCVYNSDMSLAQLRDTDAKGLFAKLLNLEVADKERKAKAYLDQVDRNESDLAIATEATRQYLQHSEEELEEIRSRIKENSSVGYDDLGEQLQTVRRNASNSTSHITTLEGYRAQLDQQLEHLRASDLSYMEYINQCTSYVNVAEARITDAETNLCKSCGAPVNGLVDLSSMKASVEEYKKAINEARAKREKFSEQIKKVQADLEYNTNALRQCRDTLQTLKIKELELSKIVTDRNSRLSNLRGQESLCLENIERFKQTIQESENALAQWREEEAAAKAVVHAYGKEGIKAMALSAILPWINARLGYYLSIVSDGMIEATFEATTDTGKEKLHVNVQRKNGGTGYQSLSYGERTRLDLALALALLDRIRMVHPVPVVLFDELFDEVDAVGVERIVELLKERAENTQIWVITHNHNVSNLVEDRILLVKENGSTSYGT